MKICDECETVAHCTKHGCIPKVSAKYAMRSARDALEARCGTNAEERGPTGAITLLNAALADQPAPVQQGWKLVPVEPTVEMLQAADDGDDEYTRRNFGPRVQRVMQGPYDHYVAMLAAAPQPAQQQERCHLCDCTGDIHSPDGEWHGECPHCKPAQQEPIYQIKGFDTGNAWHDAIHDAYDMTLSRDRRIVYASPQPAQRKPLDAGEISRLWKQHTSEDGPHHNPYDDDGLGFARAIEAAHGIKENT